MEIDITYDDYFEYMFVGYALECLSYLYILVNQFMGAIS